MSPIDYDNYDAHSKCLAKRFTLQLHPLSVGDPCLLAIWPLFLLWKALCPEASDIIWSYHNMFRPALVTQFVQASCRRRDKYLFAAPVRPMSFLCVLRWNRWTSLWPVGSSIVCTYCYCSLKSLKSMAGLQTTRNHTLVVMNKDAIWFLRRGSPPNSLVHW